MKTYRNIFFKKNIITSGTGTEIVRYYGHMYGNCEQIKNFRDMYDRLLDLYVPCNDCARNKYHSFVKIAGPNA